MRTEDPKEQLGPRAYISLKKKKLWRNDKTKEKSLTL